MQDGQAITDEAQLRVAYHEPAPAAFEKVIDHLDAGASDFIAASPFFVMATAGSRGADASPRGGPPGFVRTLDAHRLAWGDLVGNNRLDSFGNLLEQPDVGLVFLVPGFPETLRVNGTAQLLQDEPILEAVAVDGRVPKTAVVVTVRECYVHCGAALRRSDLWNPDSWPSRDRVPAPATILKAHMGAEAPAEEIEAGLEHYYDNYIWYPGGRAD